MDEDGFVTPHDSLKPSENGGNFVDIWRLKNLIVIGIEKNLRKKVAKKQGTDEDRAVPQPELAIVLRQRSPCVQRTPPLRVPATVRPTQKLSGHLVRSFANVAPSWCPCSEASAQLILTNPHLHAQLVQ
ncbi:hypothetical protein NL676_034549 [Syzygium grande]|nr:hypothetical protein NL676_034549 [Syzygium grande]